MARPVVGIIGNRHIINGEYEVQAGGVMNADAVAEVCGAIPLIVPADSRFGSAAEFAEACDGFVFTGGRPNVHPEEYGEAPTEAHGAFDRARDRLTLPLIRHLIARGQPLLAICRGFQELNVALGGTLHPEIRELPGRMNHRMPPDGTIEEKFALRHEVRLTPGGPFARLMGSEAVMTNTLHGQGLVKLGERLVVDGWAPDGTAEAAYVEGAPGFVLGVQWHPEYQAARDAVSRALFGAFGKAVARWAAGERPAALRAARSA